MINNDPYYRKCARRNYGNCDGRITIEHAIIYAGKQLSEMWSYVPLCWYHHLGPGLNKEINIILALNRATDEELAEISKAQDYRKLRDHLNKKYNNS